jgi:hypothetical protein|tara:strand:- start:186 stop:359 length:174 start_codon:yes stop_codon:yes gene_type:complete
MYEVKIGFDTKKQRFEIGDPIDKEALDPKTWKELCDMGAIGKKEVKPKEKKKKGKSV